MFAFLSGRSARLVALDVLAALAVAAVVAFATLDPDAPGAVEEPAWVSWLAAVVIAGPIAVRRRWPRPVLLVVMAAVVLALVFGVIPVVAIAAPLIAVALVLYVMGFTEARRTSVIALVSSLVTFASAVGISVLLHLPFEPVVDVIAGISLGWLFMAIGWALGFTARVRRHYAERAAEQAAQQAVNQAVADERLRIARELHDIVAHSMSLIAVKAGIGNHVARDRPVEAREALRAIESTSRGSLAEMRHLLGVLRSEVDGVELGPAPGLAALGDLATRAAAAGVAVELDVPESPELPGGSEGIGLAVYRIAQEAVTNVVRHAAPARCAVTVSIADSSVRVEVANDGPVVRLEGPAGHGLIGMRERVTMYGGTFSAGPRPAGGFLVSATIPLTS